MLTVERLKEALMYESDTGIFRWRVIRSQNGRAGNIAGSKKVNGYIDICIDRMLYKAHRLAWFYMTGKWPSEGLDHINTDRTDNRWANLRLANKSQNEANSPRNKANTSGFKGVSRKRNKWQAGIKKDYVRYNLGSFATPEEAHQAYCEAAKETFGEFARFS